MSPNLLYAAGDQGYVYAGSIRKYLETSSLPPFVAFLCLRLLLVIFCGDYSCAYKVDPRGRPGTAGWVQEAHDNSE